MPVFDGNVRYEVRYTVQFILTEKPQSRQSDELLASTFSVSPLIVLLKARSVTLRYLSLQEALLSQLDRATSIRIGI